MIIYLCLEFYRLATAQATLLNKDVEPICI